MTPTTGNGQTAQQVARRVEILEELEPEEKQDSFTIYKASVIEELSDRNKYAYKLVSKAMTVEFGEDGIGLDY